MIRGGLRHCSPSAGGLRCLRTRLFPLAGTA
jgi:hypothetical protein